MNIGVTVVIKNSHFSTFVRSACNSCVYGCKFIMNARAFVESTANEIQIYGRQFMLN